VALPFYIKRYLKAKEELWEKSKVFHNAKILSSKKSSQKKKTKILQDIVAL
jgi:hypothetical protein